MENKKKIKKDALFLIDGSYFLYRSYFAMPPLYNSGGKPTQATYAFCRTINKLIKDFDPKRIAIVWDSKGGSKKNKDRYKEYKATRPAPPVDLFEQKKDILRFIETIGMLNVAEVGYEADDLIGSIAKENKEQVVVVCADKDMYQLLEFEDVLVMDTFKNRIVDAESYEQENGFSPEKVIFYHALLGDKSDNIPGVFGVGKKTALGLVQNFNSLDDLYNNLDKVEKKRTRTLLQEHKDDAYLSLDLFTLDYHKVEIEKGGFDFDKKNWANARTFFEELELKLLIKDLKERPAEIVKPNLVQYSLFPKNIKKSIKWKCEIISNIKQLKILIKKIKKDKLIGLDTETTGLLPLIDKLVGISFASDKETAYYLPLRHPVSEEFPQIDQSIALEMLKPILESKIIKKTLHCAKFDELVLWNNGITLEGVVFDSLIAANLVRNPRQKINLKDLSKECLGESMLKFKEVMGSKYKKFSEVPIELGAEYGAHDALQTLKLKDVIEKKINAEPKIKELFDTIEMPLSRVLLKMEKKGILLDPKLLKKTLESIECKLSIIEGKIFAAIPKSAKPEELNLNSPKQIEALLFDHLNLPVVKKTRKGERSTDKEVLNELGKKHPIPGTIMQHRELNKLINTYLKPLPEYINPRTGRIHTFFSQTMTATGRLSSANPNLQNIPASIDHGIQIRSAFVAPRGSMFLSADYSQIELRVLAHFTHDDNLIKAFKGDADIHKQTAAQLFSIPISKVTHDQRQVGKRINFSIIYGLTPYGLSRELGIKPGEAKEYIKKYFEQYPKVSVWMEEIIQKTIKDGYVESWWGKRRYIPELYEQNRTRQELGRRLAVNTPIQSTSADIMKIAMINIDKAFEEKKLDAELVLQIHDELVVEMPNSEADTVKKIVQYEMESVVSWEAPLKVTIRVGDNWGEITK